MEKETVNKYQQGKIYKIHCEITEDEYIGSTCIDLDVRLDQHDFAYKTYANGKKCRYMSSFDIMKNGKCKIELIEDYPCENLQQLRAREGYYIGIMKCVNKNRPGRTKAQHYKDNRIEILKKAKQYWTDNVGLRTKTQMRYVAKHRAKHNAYQRKYQTTRNRINNPNYIEKLKKQLDKQMKKIKFYDVMALSIDKPIKLIRIKKQAD